MVNKENFETSLLSNLKWRTKPMTKHQIKQTIKQRSCRNGKGIKDQSLSVLIITKNHSENKFNCNSQVLK